MEYLTPSQIRDIDFDDAKYLINPRWTANDCGAEVLEIDGEIIALSYYYFKRQPADYTNRIVRGAGINIAAILSNAEYEELYSDCEDLLDLPFNDATRTGIIDVICEFFDKDQDARYKWEIECWINEDEDEDEDDN